MPTVFVSKRAAETKRVQVDFYDSLGAKELLTGTPTVQEMFTTDLTFSGIGFNTSDLFIAHAWRLASTVVEFLVAGGTSGRIYSIQVSATSDATTAQTRIKDVQLKVN